MAWMIRRVAIHGAAPGGVKSLPLKGLGKHLPCSTNCLPGNISGRTVVITDGLETGEVQVAVTLAPGFHFANSSGNGE